VKKNIAILGSTGSIGTQALDVIQKNTDKFQIEVLTANNNANLLIAQAKKFKPNAVVIGNKEQYSYVKEALENDFVKVFAGNDAICQIVENDNIHMVLSSLVGYAGVLPTINAIKSGKHIALANKETLVVAGKLITDLAKKNKVNIIPVDSEHSAIFQCLAGELEYGNKIESITLTASGGPFRGFSKSQLENVSPKEALKHPNWDMGSKVTIDSASLMNKGLEVIEARWLFNLKPDQIKVVVHPQSIVHSAVTFEDGSMKAQLGLPDMKLPIQYALSYPQRIFSDLQRFNLIDYPELTFEKPNTKIFRNLELAFNAMEKCGNLPCIMNAANEIVVDAFLKEKTSFFEMTEIIEKTMQTISYIKYPTYDDFVTTDKESRLYAESLL